MGWFNRQKARSQDKGGSMARRISKEGTKQTVVKNVTVKQAERLIPAMLELGYGDPAQSPGAFSNMLILTFHKQKESA
jgi:hypothetical protein